MFCFSLGQGILGDFLFFVATRPAQGPIQFSFSEYRALSLGTKTAECEAVHLPPSSAKVLCGPVPALPFLTQCLFQVHRQVD
jgi:hypothetical protein